MNIYERFGVKPIINVAGPLTRCGGALMEPEALEAMDEAAKYSVHLEQLEAAASKVIAEKTHAEAGLVTAGAYAALTLGTAACITGFDVARMNRLPDTSGLPNEVIMVWHQISGYDHAIRAAGAKLLGVGIPNDPIPPDEVEVNTKWDIESAITENTVAIAYGFREGSHPPLEQVIEIGKKYNIPVMVDAAAQVPPVENLYRFIDMGADLVCFSGGKCIRGPQASGILCGRRDLIASAAIQMLDMAGPSYDEWEPPASLIPKDKLYGRPQHGIGRGAKVSKEAIIGLLVALQNLTEEGWAKKAEHLRKLLWSIGEPIKDIAGVELGMAEHYEGGYPALVVMIDEKVLGRSAGEVKRGLREGKPSIEVQGRLKTGDRNIRLKDGYTNEDLLLINSTNLDEEVARIVGERLYTAITG